MSSLSVPPFLPHFVDPSIPGLSGGDLVRRIGRAISSCCVEMAETLADARRDHALRKDLGRLDAALLRDVGLLRDRA